MSEDKRYYGIYAATCVNNEDPDKTYKIEVKVPQVTGDATHWALPCLPVTSDAEHLDHKTHTAAQVAALLVNHSLSVTSGPASAGTAHTHNVTATLSHTGNSNTLKHPHITSTDDLDTDGSELGLTAAEHTYHRKVPNIDQAVWVMFIAGDPNFPVWMGVQL